MIYRDFKKIRASYNTEEGRDPFICDTKSLDFPELHYFTSYWKNQSLGNVYDTIDNEWKKPTN